MDGNLAMVNNFVNETEEANNFWADVHDYMEDHKCTLEVAIDKIRLLYGGKK